MKESTDLMVVQPNSITNAHYTLSSIQRDIVLMAVGQLNTNIITTKDDGITFNIKQLHKLTESKMQKSKYVRTIKNALEDLTKQTLTIRTAENKTSTFPWIEQYDQDFTNSTVTLYLNPKVARLFSLIEEKYTQYKLKYIFRLNTAYSKRLYELVMQNKPDYKSVPALPLQELKALFNLSGKYEKYADFKRKVLQKIIQDINENTDINLQIDETRIHSQIKVIRFRYDFKTQKHADVYKVSAKNKYITKLTNADKKQTINNLRGILSNA